MSTATKYVNFALRLVFRDVRTHFLTPSIDPIAGAFAMSGLSPELPAYEGFALVELEKARLSFDAYIDQQSEFDIICEAMQLCDSRLA